MVMESMMGVKTDKLKLSDFMDESFFEDIDNTTRSTDTYKETDKMPLSQLIQQFIEESEHSLIDNLNKRLKTSKANGVIKPRMMLMSPLMALAVHATHTLLSTDWKQRQSSAVILNNIFKCNNLSLEYCYLQQDAQLYTVSTRTKFDNSKVMQNIFPRLIILIMKDHFSDFEELKVLTPVREEAIKAVVTFQDCDELKDDFALLVDKQLPFML